MQHILFCTDFLLAGGVERQLTELITRLDPSEFQIQVICLYANKTGKTLHFAKQIEAHNIQLQVLDLRMNLFAKLKAMFVIWRLCWRFRPHILHPVNYHSNLLTRMIRPFLPPSTKIIGTVRVEYTLKQLRYERFTQWACKKIVCNSPHIQQQLIETAHIPAKKIAFIPNGIDTQRFHAANGATIRAQFAPNFPKLFLSVGRISKQKAQHYLIEAIGQLKSNNHLDENFHLILIGDIEESGIQNKIASLIKQYNLSEVISQLPSTSHPEHYYQAADVTILFSKYEGMPNVALESLAAGKPVIISEQANAAKIIEHNQTGWIVRTGDIEHLAETITTVMNLPQNTLRTMQDACLKRAQDFTMNKMVAHYTDLYRTL